MREERVEAAVNMEEILAGLLQAAGESSPTGEPALPAPSGELEARRRALLLAVFRHPERIGIDVGFRDLKPIHGLWIRNMVFGTKDYTLQAHRAAFKSSCLAVSIALMMVLFPSRNVIFVRKADTDVSEMLRMVSKILLTSCFARLVGALYPGVSLSVTEEASDHLSTNLYTSPMGSSQLLGLGMKTSITGKHAHFVITDDICNVNDRLSKAERDRTKLQYMELQNIKNREGRMINLGTPWHPDDVFSIMRNIHRYDCYTTGLISPEKLELIRQSMLPSLFAANYELLHVASEDAVFGTAPRTGADPALLRDGIAHIDAAYAGEDYTAFTCASRKEDTIYIYGRLWRKHVSEVLPLILEETRRLCCAPIYVESNGDKGFLCREIRDRDFYGKSYFETENKLIKISTHLRKWWPNVVFVEGTDREYVNQILDYTETSEHDDAPDSAACVCRILGKRW